MNTKILAAFFATALITGCASLNKATNTPDDIYYSAPPTAKASSPANDAGYDQYENYQANNDDQYLRMKVQNQTKWGSLDDYSYWNDSRYDYGYSCDASRDMLLSSLYMPYGLGYGAGYYSYYGGLGLGYGIGYGGFGFGYGYGGWASPYQTVVMYRNPKVYFNGTNKANLTAYRNIQYNNYNSTKYSTVNQGGGNYTTRGGSFNNNNNNYVAPSRSFSTGSATNSAGGRSGGFNSAGSSAGGARPTRH
jgi:hypothetical protein